MSLKKDKNIKSLKVSFIAVPKTASYSIVKTCEKFDSFKNLGHATLSSDIIKELNSSTVSFCFVRNPYDRFLSGYRYINKWSSDSKSKHSVSIGLSLDHCRSFDDFVKQIFDITDSLPVLDKRPMLSIKNMKTFQPQTFFIYTDGKKIINEVLRYENLQKEWCDFLIKYSLPYSQIVKRRNKSSLSVQDMGKNSWHDMYSDKIADIIYEYYKDDFKLLGYKKESYKRLS
jgi:hypothetical protein